jgi:hypothetical protein
MLLVVRDRYARLHVSPKGGDMRWKWILIVGACSLVGAAILLTALPHSSFQPYGFPGGIGGPNPYSFPGPGGVRPGPIFPGPGGRSTGPIPFPQHPPPLPARPSVPTVTTGAKLFLICLGVILLAIPWFRQSERGQGIVATLITSGALALIGQTVVP